MNIKVRIKHWDISLQTILSQISKSWDKHFNCISSGRPDSSLQLTSIISTWIHESTENWSCVVKLIIKCYISDKSMFACVVLWLLCRTRRTVQQLQPPARQNNPANSGGWKWTIIWDPFSIMRQRRRWAAATAANSVNHQPPRHRNCAADY